jgi:hypothetical protein
MAGGESCVPVNEGQLDSLSGVACTDELAPGALIELVVRWSCPSTDDEVYADAINVSCVQAIKVMRAWSGQDACAEPDSLGATCTPLAGWRCSATIADFGAAGTVASRCWATPDLREGVDVTWVLPP